MSYRTNLELNETGPHPIFDENPSKEIKEEIKEEPAEIGDEVLNDFADVKKKKLMADVSL